MDSSKLSRDEIEILDNRQIKINKQKEGTHIDDTVHNTNTITIVIILFVLSLLGMVFIRFLENIYMGSKNLSLIRMFGIAIVLNVMILIFIIMSFKRIYFSQGPVGPKGNRGNKGLHGNNAVLNSCAVGDSVLLSGQKKYNIRKREASYARYPAIVDDY
jgi:hypothetical protein